MRILSLSTIVGCLLTGVFARSSVYIVSDKNTVTENIPEVSLNGFNSFYSHLMDTSSQQPALFIQESVDQNDQDVLTPWISSSDIFQRKVDSSLMLVLSSVQFNKDILPDMDPSFYVADNNSISYVGIAENTMEHILNKYEDSFATFYTNDKAAFQMGKEHLDQTLTLPSMEAVYESFKSVFNKRDTGIFDMNKDADQLFIREVVMVKTLFDSKELVTKIDLNLIEMNSLELIATEYGANSDQNKQAHLILSDLITEYVIPAFHELNINHSTLSTIVMTPYLKQQHKRDVLSTSAINSVCYPTLEDCNNGTASCSKQGSCIAVKDDCFTCACDSTFTGESCQYIDAVGDFQLLFWTSVLLIVVTTSVVGCVYQSGNTNEGGILMAQSLPKQD
ncbi:hypothetical protein BDB01DRAFT_768781 [Pilobolus umbonatus]|nr:hypothetical protein BDB01DRAFT_768781 [Pilobolus umbonatus]